MSDKVSIIVPKEPENYMVWLAVKDKVQADVHFGLEGQALVIGSNTKRLIAGKENFTNPALVVDKDGKISLQYADENGEVAWKELEESKVAKEILKMLKKFKKM